VSRQSPLAVLGGLRRRQRSAATGEEYLPEQVHAVVETQLAYLRAIGAVGDAAQPDPEDPRS